MNASLLQIILVIAAASLIVAALLSLLGYSLCPLEKLEYDDDVDLDDNAIMYVNTKLYNEIVKEVNKIIKYYKRAYALKDFLRYISIFDFLAALFLVRQIPGDLMYRYLVITSLLPSVLFMFSLKLSKTLKDGLGYAKISISELMDDFKDLKYEYGVEVTDERVVSKLKDEKLYMKSIIYNINYFDLVMHSAFLFVGVFLVLLSMYSLVH